MKIEYAQSIKNIPEKPQPQLLRQGEFIVSEVVEVKGDTALLRNAQGMLLAAKLLGDLGLMAGDHVETVVDEAGVGRYVLRVVDLSRGGEQAALGGLKTSADTAAQGIKAQALHNTLAMLKRNTGLDPKTAEFIAKNGLADTPENIETLGKLARGEQRVAQVLTQIQSDTASAGTVTENMTASSGRLDILGQRLQAQAPVTLAPEAQSFGMAETSPLQNADNKAAVTPPMQSAPETTAEIKTTPGIGTRQTTETVPPAVTAEPASVLQGEKAIPAGTALAEPAKEVLGKAPDYVPADPQAEAAAAKTADNRPILIDNIIMKPMAESPAAGQPSAPEPSVLLRHLFSMFVDLRERDTASAQLKKAVEELPEQIKELKLSAQTTDNNDRNTLAQKAESLDRQFSLMSDVKRFDCYHVPVMGANGSPATAELYVYRQRRRKPDKEPETFAILLGLDTQFMGRVEAMVKAKDRSVSLEFRLEQAELTGAFSENAAQLESAIAGAGYSLTSVNVKELEARTTVLNAEETLAQGQAVDTGGLDVRV